MADTDIPVRRLLKVPEAAIYLAVSVAYLNALRCRGGGPVFVRMGRAVAYHPDDLEAWLAARRRTSTSDQGDAR
jgi:predicted DNA-binding transcriptional regulator AlpA